jgi:hypothetical protein
MYDTNEATLAVTVTTWQAKRAFHNTNVASPDSNAASHDTNAASHDMNAASHDTTVTSHDTTAALHDTTAICVKPYDALRGPTTSTLATCRTSSGNTLASTSNSPVQRPRFAAAHKERR